MGEWVLTSVANHPPAAGNGITVLTWAGDAVTFRVLEIRAAARPLFTPALPHPVL